MSDNNRIHELMGQALQAYHPFYSEDVIKWQRDIEVPDNWFVLNAIRANEPQALSMAEVNRMAPYAAIERQRERHDELAEAGYLIKDGDDSYRLSEQGRAVIEGFFTVAHVGMGKTNPLLADELDQLRVLLERLVVATLNAAEPVEKVVLEGSRWTDPGPDVDPSVAIDQSVTDLLRFRDDAHIAAWRPLGIDGRCWETLTFVWRGEANTAAALAERLPFRGNSEEQYRVALEELAGRSWVSSQEGTYQITEAGRSVREQAEVETDRLYYGPWSALDDIELDQLEDLLNRAVENLNKMAMERFWPLAIEVAQAIFPVTRDTVQPAISEKFEDPSIFFPVLLAIGNEPELFSATAYRKRTPYIKADQIDQRLKVAVSEGYLADAGDGSYTVTGSGKEVVAAVNDIFYTRLGEIDPLADGGSAELADFLDRLVEASLAAEEPTGKWAITNMHNCHPEQEYAPLAKIDQYLDDLNAFRDDVHNAAWQEHAVDGKTWETLTFVWRGDASSPAELEEKLSFRGYVGDDYAESLSQLEEKGWVVQGDEGFQATPEGKKIRQEVEEATNRIFYAPWTALDDGEQFRLRDLLIRMKLGLEDLDKTEEA